MNVTFQTLNTAYRPTVPVKTKQVPRTEKIKGDYDTVNIRRSQAAPEDDETFARMLARKAAAQLGDGASQEKRQEVSRRVSDGSYKPDAQRIAGRLLGLG